MDRIFIKDLLARCVLGVTEEERREKQDVLISVDLFTDVRGVGQTDRFEEALDYRSLKKQVLTVVENSEYHLIEALAEQIAAICLQNPLVERVTVRAEKPTVLRFARSVGVEITRSRT
jgi:dihydroneopterin aldolase/D-erythro-7,8-dihydroneopterin triphosphate epimerase